MKIRNTYSVTETGIKRLIAWNKIHGFEDKLDMNMAYPEPISDDEMNVIFSDFKKNKIHYKNLEFKITNRRLSPIS